MSPEMPSTPMPPPPMGVAGPPPMPLRPPPMPLRPPPMPLRPPPGAEMGPPPMMARDAMMSRRRPEGMGPNRAKGGPIKAKKYAKGGSVSSRADGCATKGKTKGKMV